MNRSGHLLTQILEQGRRGGGGEPFILGHFSLFLKKKAASLGHPEIPVWSGTETPAAPAGWHTSRCRSRRGKACPCEENGPKNATLRASRRRRAAHEEGELGRGGAPTRWPFPDGRRTARGCRWGKSPSGGPRASKLGSGDKTGAFWLPPAPSPPLFHPRSSQPLGPPPTPPGPYVPTMPTTT